MTDVFPTAFFQSAGVKVCPNGDKLRSDDDGSLFCVIDGKRVSAIVDNGFVKLVEVVIDGLDETVSASRGRKRSGTDSETGAS